MAGGIKELAERLYGEYKLGGKPKKTNESGIGYFEAKSLMMIQARQAGEVNNNILSDPSKAVDRATRDQIAEIIKKARSR
jgi:hypothetical protein